MKLPKTYICKLLILHKYWSFLLWEQNPDVLTRAVFQGGLEECCGGPIPGNADHRVSEADLRTESVQTTNKDETPLGLVPKKTSHTRTHTMGEGEKRKTSKNKLRREKAWLGRWLHTDGSTPMNAWETKPEKQRLPYSYLRKGPWSPVGKQ